MIPKVLSEKETFNLVRDKRLNLARYGDGEFKLAMGKDIKLQPNSKMLQYHMQHILRYPHPNCLPAIQNIYDPNLFNLLPEGKKQFWAKYKGDKITQYLDPNMTYGSSFVGRKDNAPWISCDDILEWKTLWEDEVVISVVGHKKWAIDIIDNTKKTIEIQCPEKNAFLEFTNIMDDIVKVWEKENAYIVVLHLGPTATVLANSLAYRGIWAIDLGSWQFNYSCECRKLGHKYK
jgi:hypothetical protein